MNANKRKYKLGKSYVLSKDKTLPFRKIQYHLQRFIRTDLRLSNTQKAILFAFISVHLRT